MRAVAWVLGIGTLIGAGVYTALSVVRWEWNRALFFGLVFVAAQLALATALLLRRLDALPTDEHHPPELAAVRAARHDHVRFRWLRARSQDAVNRTGVFITLLVGSGVVLSGLAWALDKLGAATTDRRREARLARELRTIRYPVGGLLVDEATALAAGHAERHVERVRSLTGEHR